jgi:hypothetical protein
LALALLASLARSAAAAPAPGAAELVPADCAAALLLDDGAALDGLRAFLAAAAEGAPSLRPALLGQDLARQLGVDPLTDQSPGGRSPSGGSPGGQSPGGRSPGGGLLAPAGARALVAVERGLGLSAPVADAPAAQQAVSRWLEQVGPVRAPKGARVPGLRTAGSERGERAAALFELRGEARLVTASGPRAAQLVERLFRAARGAKGSAPLAEGRPLLAALAQVPGPARLWVRGQRPVQGVLLQLDAAATELHLRGLLLGLEGAAEAPAALLNGAGPAAEACAGTPLVCLRAAPGPLLRSLAPPALRGLLTELLRGPERADADQLLQALAAAARGGALLRIEAFEPRALGRSPAFELASLDLWAASGSAGDQALQAALAALPAAEPEGARVPGLPACAGQREKTLWLALPCRRVEPPPLEGGPTELFLRLDAQALARSLAGVTPLDALHGQAGSALFGLKLLWGGLLARSGPVELRAAPPEGAAVPGALLVDLRWPLSGKPPPQ